MQGEKRNLGFFFSQEKPRVLMKRCVTHVGMALNFVAGGDGGRALPKL